MALPTASDNPFPSLLITEGTEPSAPAAGKQRLYIDSTSHKLMVTNSSGTESVIGPGGAAAIATDTIWDAAGDLVQGTGADAAAKLSAGTAGKILTAAGAAAAVGWGQGPMTTTGDLMVGATGGTPTRLALGAAGGAVSRINGVITWNSGTSFPGSAASGDRYWRTDLSAEYFYDGTRWLSTSIITLPFGPNESTFPLTADGLVGRGSTWGATDFWMVEMLSSLYVATTNDGTHYWTITLNKNNAAGTPTSVASYTTAADTVNNYTAHQTAIGALLGAFKSFQVNAVKTSTPGSLYWSGFLHVRVVGT